MDKYHGRIIAVAELALSVSPASTQLKKGHSVPAVQLGRTVSALPVTGAMKAATLM
jgi:hypothetical protein